MPEVAATTLLSWRSDRQLAVTRLGQTLDMIEIGPLGGVTMHMADAAPVWREGVWKPVLSTVLGENGLVACEAVRQGEGS